ncbi:MAG: nitrate reductase [Clostridia bacterium]|nr:nitrate reductase [Clostridia bacterium]
MSILSFVISVLAGIVANYIFAMLNDNDDGDDS